MKRQGRGILFGHRGAAGEAPENTLAGFDYAYGAGVRAFELDVRLTADGELVLLHDEDLARTTGHAGKVRDHTLAELQLLDARFSCPEWPTAAGIPTLGAVLAAFQDLEAYQIEIKTDLPGRLERVASAVIQQIERFRLQHRVTITSFDRWALSIMRQRAPSLPRGLIARYDGPADLETARSLECRNACVPLDSGSAGLVELAHASGLEVTGWLGNSEAGLTRLLEWGVDSITSDFPSRALPFLTSRGFLAERKSSIEE